MWQVGLVVNILDLRLGDLSLNLGMSMIDRVYS